MDSPPKESKRRRYMPRLFSEPGNSYIERMPSPTNSIAQSLPTLPTRIKDGEVSTGTSQDLPMSFIPPLASVNCRLPSDSAGQDEEDISLPLGDDTTERQLTTRFQLDSYDKNETQPKTFGASSFLNTQGPLERYLAQDAFYANVDDQQNTNATFLRLRTLRANALRLRSILRTKRKLLREKQSEKAEADDAFMRYVREHMFSKGSPAIISKSDGLHELFYAMQETRNIYGPLQEDYNEAEETLDDTEFELGMLEGRFHKITIPSNPETSGGEVPNEITSRLSPLAPSSLTDSSSGIGEEFHPLHSQLLSRLGDLDIATERLHGMRQEYENLFSDQESRLHVGHDLPESLKSRLAELPEWQLALGEEIAEIEKDVEKLHSDCLAAGVLVDDDGEGRNAPDAGKDEIRDGNEICTANDEGDILHGITSPSDTSTQSIQSTFPLLLPRTEDEEANVNRLAPKFDESNKGGQINHWLLVELQASRLHVDLLHRISDDIFIQWKLDLNIQKWQIAVLQFWAKDEANKFSKGQDTYALSSTTQSHPFTVLRRRPYAKSINSLSGHLAAPPKLHFRKSAPGLLEYPKMLNGDELLEKS
ncbi:hypothetical protein DL98DRAFT_616354 [Cadophora sp. DSE1049]|nr:hypothetical protein DL98DRAFT_616354 [Cadophora sp. DSE1049]